MADLFTNLPHEIQREIHSFALSKILTDQHFKRLNRMKDRMRIAISLLQEIAGPNLEGKPGYFIVFPVEAGGDGSTIFDLNNPYVLRVLSYVAKVFDPKLSQYFDVDNAWWYSLVVRLVDNVITTYDELEYHYLSRPDFLVSHAQFRRNLKSVTGIASRIADKLVLHYPMGFPFPCYSQNFAYWELETD
jgi:hypothetical protein